MIDARATRLSVCVGAIRCERRQRSRAALTLGLSVPNGPPIRGEGPIEGVRGQAVRAHLSEDFPLLPGRAEGRLRAARRRLAAERAESATVALRMQTGRLRRRMREHWIRVGTLKRVRLAVVRG